jgi:hypothetical protein
MQGKNRDEKCAGAFTRKNRAKSDTAGSTCVPGTAGVLSCWLGVLLSPASPPRVDGGLAGSSSSPCADTAAAAAAEHPGCSDKDRPVAKGARGRGGSRHMSAGHHLEQWWLGKWRQTKNLLKMAVGARAVDCEPKRRHCGGKGGGGDGRMRDTPCWMQSNRLLVLTAKLSLAWIPTNWPLQVSRQFKHAMGEIALPSRVYACAHLPFNSRSTVGSLCAHNGPSPGRSGEGGDITSSISAKKPSLYAGSSDHNRIWHD